jgi:hypothetical protein
MAGLRTTKRRASRGTTAPGARACTTIRVGRIKVTSTTVSRRRRTVQVDRARRARSSGACALLDRPSGRRWGAVAGRCGSTSGATTVAARGATT